MRCKAKRLVKNSVLLSWLMSYFSVLIIPILISGFLFVESTRIVENEINRANANLLKQVQQTIDNQLMDIEKLSIQIAWNDRLQGLMNVREPLKSHHRYAITQIIKDFKVYSVALGFINNFYVYLGNTDIVLSPNSMYDAQLAYTVFHKQNDMTFEQWVELVHGKYNKVYMPLNKKGEKDKTSNTIAYIQSLPLEDINRTTATVVILLNESRFKEAVMNIRWLNQGVALIIDDSDNILAATKPIISLPILDYDGFKQSDGLVYDVLDGQDVVISHISSQVTGWKYVSIIPRDIVMDKVGYIPKFGDIFYQHEHLQGLEVLSANIVVTNT